MSESKFWGDVKPNTKAVTISDNNQTIYFKSYKKCAKYISDFSGMSFNKVQNLLTAKAKFILDFQIFYETEK